MSSHAYFVYVKGMTLGSGEIYIREIKPSVILAYFRMDNGRVISAKEREDYNRLIENPRATLIEDKS